MKKVDEDLVKRVIPVKPEEPQMPPFEECCFCGKETPNWTAIKTRAPGEQVACCRRCAQLREPDEVPTKAEWMGLV